MKMLHRKKVGASVLVLAATCLVASACSSSSSHKPANSAAGGAPAGSSAASNGSTSAGGAGASLTVWADTPRLGAVNAFIKSHPDVKVNLVTIPHTPGYSVTKISLANTANKGWPDVLFPYGADLIPLVSQFKFALPLDGLIDNTILDGFAKGSLGKCTVGGKLYCLRNDTGQTVLWYNAKLMKQFGYTVPTTWAQYQQLGTRVAKDHPGYLIGNMNGSLGAAAYFDSSGCPTHQLMENGSAKINTKLSECTRVADMLQPLVENGTVSTLNWSDPAFVAQSSHILMMPAGAWAGTNIFKNTLKTPAGEITTADMPTWPGQSTPSSGEDGGGEWMVSSHASKATQAAAISMIEWLTTEPQHQVGGPTVPAYTKAADAWCKDAASGGYFASDPCAVLQKAAGEINPVSGIVGFLNQWVTTYNATVVAAAHAKSSISGSLSKWETQLDAAAAQEGTKVQK